MVSSMKFKRQEYFELYEYIFPTAISILLHRKEAGTDKCRVFPVGIFPKLLYSTF